MSLCAIARIHLSKLHCLLKILRIVTAGNLGTLVFLKL